MNSKVNKESDALILVDIQNDFLPGGALEVKGGDEIIPLVNEIQNKFDKIFATQDFHPSHHKSFATNHSGEEIGNVIEWKGLSQILWPDHCVQGSKGTEFHSSLDQSRWTDIIQKGTNPDIDSYSGFFDNAWKLDTGLNERLKLSQVKRVFIVGLALDYCIKFTALDATKLGYETVLLVDCTKAVNLSPEDGEKAMKELQEAGVELISSGDIK